MGLRGFPSLVSGTWGVVLSRSCFLQLYFFNSLSCWSLQGRNGCFRADIEATAGFSARSDTWSVMSSGQGMSAFHVQCLDYLPVSLAHRDLATVLNL